MKKISNFKVGILNIIILEQFSNEHRKTKTKVITWPITKDTDNPANQSKLEVNTCSRHKARENVREEVAIGFGSII